jgi:hypothetical protein
MRYACENQNLNFTKGVVTKYITNKQRIAFDLGKKKYVFM